MANRLRPQSPGIDEAPRHCLADSEVLGVTVARCTVGNDEGIEDLESYCRHHDVGLAIARVPGSAIAAAQKLSARGYVLSDTLLYFGCLVKRAAERLGTSEVPVRAARPDESAGIAALAREAFRKAPSHYHADPRISLEASREIYARWAERSCATPEPGERVLVAEHQGESIGLGILRVSGDGFGEALLAGVHPSSPVSGAFVYRALLAEGTRIAESQGAKRAVTSTQVDNVVVQKLLTLAGWVPQGAYYTFHKWYR